MKSVVEAGYTNVPLLRKASEESLKKLLGPVKGANLFTMAQKDGWANASEIDLFIASPLRPDGIGKTRLEGLMAVEPDVTRWKSEVTVPKGWSEESLKEFQEVWSKYEEFRKDDWSFISYPKRATEGSNTSSSTTLTFTDVPMIYKGSIVFSGVRDVTLEKSLEKRGYKISDSVKSDTKALIIADSEDPQLYKSGKAEKAKKIPGCLILRKIDSAKL
jgi:hypothetical protein